MQRAVRLAQAATAAVVRLNPLSLCRTHPSSSVQTILTNTYSRLHGKPQLRLISTHSTPLLSSTTSTAASSATAATPASQPSSSSSSPSSSPLSDVILTPPPFASSQHGSSGDRRFVYLKGVKVDGRSKRFYASVGLEEVNTVRGREIALLLDGRFIVTPYDQLLTLPTTAAALAVAFEWDAQADFIRPASMPMTNIAVTALDQAFVDRERFFGHFDGCIKTDSVFMRVRHPPGLVTQQRRHWDPLLLWFRDRYRCTLQTTFELRAPDQSEDSVAIQKELLRSLDGWQLAALDVATTVSKSFVISWALLANRLSVQQAAEAARVEENYQQRQYGTVEGVYGHGIEVEYTKMTLAAAKMFCNLVTNLPTETQQPAATGQQQQQQQRQ